MTIAVASIEAGTRTVWQAELMAWSFRRAGERGPLTVLSAAGRPSIPGADEVIETQNRRYYDGLDYPPYNKPHALLEWISGRARGGAPSPLEAEIFLVDPDMVWLGRTPAFASEPWHPVAQRWPDNANDLIGPAVRAVTDRTDLLQAVGPPLWIQMDDLVRVLPLWIERTKQLRRAGTLDNPWVAEMAGYVSAAADCGLSHHEVDLGCAPIFHYYFLAGCLGGFEFDKYRYRPWEPVAVPAGPPVAVAFAQLLNEYVAQRGIPAGVRP